MKNICLLRQDESAGEVNIALGEVTIGRGPLLGVSTIGRFGKIAEQCCLPPNLSGTKQTVPNLTK
jgi:hypothetical protein